MILAGIRCTGFIICSPHSVCLHTEGSMGLATDNILGLNDSESVILVLSQIIVRTYVTSRMFRVFTT